jgi:hypothetical protein
VPPARRTDHVVLPGATYVVGQSHAPRPSALTPDSNEPDPV